MQSHENDQSVLERQLLLQLGDRLRRLRKAQGLTAVAMAQKVGVSRTTLAAIEAGDPSPSMGNYLRVMSMLGVAGDLAMLVSDTFQAAPAGSAAARSHRARPLVKVSVRTDPARHEAQDLQSLALHTEALRLVRQDPELLRRALETLERWRQSDAGSRSKPLWDEWADILATGAWRKVLGRTRRAQELRQASPLPTVLPDAVRQRILAQVQALKRGVTLGDIETSS